MGKIYDTNAPGELVVVDDEHLGVLLHNSLRDLPIALVKKKCKQWASGWQEGLPVWTLQRREIFHEEVSNYDKDIWL